MTYEQAKEKALKINAKLNACREYTRAYHFYDKFDTTDRVPDNDVVILKESGKIVNLTTFIIDYHPEKIPQQRRF